MVQEMKAMFGTLLTMRDLDPDQLVYLIQMKLKMKILKMMIYIHNVIILNYSLINKLAIKDIAIKF
jgi:hypothetical protein